MGGYHQKLRDRPPTAMGELLPRETRPINGPILLLQVTHGCIAFSSRYLAFLCNELIFLVAGIVGMRSERRGPGSGGYRRGQNSAGHTDGVPIRQAPLIHTSALSTFTTFSNATKYCTYMYVRNKEGQDTQNL